MGKGKGSFLRWVIKLKKNFMAVETMNISYWNVCKLGVALEKKIKFNITPIRYNTKTYLKLGTQARAFFLLKKYNLNI